MVHLQLFKQTGFLIHFQLELCRTHFPDIKPLQIHCEMNGHLGSFLLAAAAAADNGKLTSEIYLVRHLGKKLLPHLHQPLRSARLVPEFSRG